MNNFLMFDNPKDFLSHLKDKDIEKLSNLEMQKLLAASASALEQTINSQNLMIDRMVKTVNCLNNYHETWGHKLAELYSILECGQITPDDMNNVLIEEVCKKIKNSENRC